jgi:hypothetical protein
MNEMEKYLEALEAAVEVKDRKAIELLDAFSSYVYQRLHSLSEESSGKEHETWEGMHQRARILITRMAQAKPNIWL